MATEKVVVAGASGFLGRPLCRALFADGKREVWALSRQPGIEVPYAYVRQWDGRSAGDWTQAVEGARAVINLTGAKIGAGRWTEARKKEIVESRLEPTRALTAAIAAAKKKPEVFISASASGYYGDRGDEVVDETASPGQGFIAGLCAQWEREAQRVPKGVRPVLLRTGVTLGEGGGPLDKVLYAFRMGVGGPFGSGKQWLPWISRDDAVGLILHSLEMGVYGPVNVVAPQPATNAEFAKALGRALGRPAVLRTSAFALKLLLGEASEVLLGGHRAVPRRATETGYQFKHPELDTALAASLR